MFAVTINKESSLVRVVREGFFSPEEMQQSADMVRDAVNSFQGRAFRLLVDFRKFKPGTPEVAAKLSELFTFLFQTNAERIAHLFSSNIILLQLRRLSKETGISTIARQFNNEEDAMRWLLYGDDLSI